MADIAQAINNAKDTTATFIEDAEVINHQLPGTSTGGAAVVLNLGKRSMATMGVSKGISNKIDGSWLKIDKVGLSIDNDAARFDDIEVEINMTEGVGFFVKDSIRWGDSPVNYASCYEGNITDKGLPWDATVARALAVDPKCKGVYPAVDVILTVLTDIPLKERGKVIATGTKLGFTTATSHWDNFVSFFQTLMNSGQLGQTHKVRIKATSVTSKKNGNTWGVPEFNLVA